MCQRIVPSVARVAKLLVMAALSACMAFAMSGCGGTQESGSTASEKPDFSPVRIGTMPNEHFLPMWAAEKDGCFEKEGVNAELLTFDSAQALSAAIAAGEVDMAMVDIPRAVKLSESGTSVVMEWITLGTEVSPGAFGVLAASDAPYSTLKEMVDYMSTHDDALSQAGVGVAANTVPEYVFDKLLEKDGIDPADVKTQEVASLPERYSLVASGNLAAAALPASFLRLGEASGMKVIAEESQEDNISQSVMIATQKFADDRQDDVMKVAKAWDDASEAINADPEAYSVLLAEKANLNEAIADTFPVPSYPMALVDGKLAHPASSLVDEQLKWMAGKGYSSGGIGYDESTGSFTVS